MEDSSPLSKSKSYATFEDSLKKLLKYDEAAQKVCGEILVELETTEKVLALDQSSRSIKMVKEPASLPWKSTGTKLNFSLKNHALSWTVPVEAIYKTVVKTAVNTGVKTGLASSSASFNSPPDISEPVKHITVKAGS